MRTHPFRWAAALAALTLSFAPLGASCAERLPLPPGSTVEVAFSPGRALPAVVALIAEAQTEILVAAYVVTSKPIAEALRDAYRRGVKVSVVANAGKAAEKYSGLTFLANARVPVRVNSRYAIHHHKFMVVDGRAVETGSFNFTSSAAIRNAENVLILRDAPHVAAIYAAEWHRLWAESAPFAGDY
jgi:phosphatidylserine/phosphatidylglycerophosphate/cardiolipin synthase-like enzyme